MTEDHECISAKDYKNFKKRELKINNLVLLIIFIISICISIYFRDQLFKNIYLITILIFGFLCFLVFVYQKGKKNGFMYSHQLGFDSGKLKALCIDKEFDNFHFEFEFKRLIDDKNEELKSFNIPGEKCNPKKISKKSKKDVGGIDLEITEITYRLNAYTTFSDTIDFTQVVWNLISTFLRSIKNVKELSPKQKVCIFILGKSKRLLRAIHKLIIDGYYPESLILNRTLFESQVLLQYILEGKDNSRAEKWLSRKKPTERWPISELMKENKYVFEAFYSGASMYAHNHALSSGHYINFAKNSFSIIDGPFGGGLERFQYAGNVLGHSAMTCGALCEMSRKQFKNMTEYDKSYKKLTKLPYYKKGTSEALKSLELDEKLKDHVINLLKKLD